MAGLAHRTALRVFGHLPTTARRQIVRAISPSFTVGAMCFIERSDGALLLFRHSYRERWGVPGGLLQKGEEAVDGVRREVMEEVGMFVDLLGPPTVVVDPEPQRVDVIFRAHPTSGPGVDGHAARDGRDRDEVAPRSPEIVAARWFRPEAMPELQFETADALVTLARTATETTRRRLPDPVWPRLD